MKIAVVTPKMISGEKGGAENLYEGLVYALKKKGHDTRQIEVVVDESSFDKIIESYYKCFYLDLSDYDLVISTKAPTYMVRHPNHISYLLHTIRVFYDMFEKEFDSNDKEKRRQRELIHKFDRYGLNPKRVRKHFVNGSEVYKRMVKEDEFWKNIDFQSLHHPPKIDFKEPQKGEFIFFPGRLHRWKRPDLIIESMKYVKHDVELIISGTGEDEKKYKELAKNDKRIKFIGKIDDKSLSDLYSKAIVVPFVPINEDYGLITIEAFKSRKPVITCIDSGEPTYFVKNELNGFVVEPSPKKIAEKINFLIENPNEAKKMGKNGYNSILEITWENVLSKLLKDVEPLQKELDKPEINVLITDMQPIEPAVGGGRLRLKGLYSNLGKNIKATYIGTYDWKGPKYRKIQISDSLSEIDVPLSDEHFRLNDYLNNLLSGKTIIDTVFPFLAESSQEYVETVRREAKKSDVIVISHPWIYPIIKTELNLKNKILVYDSHNCEAILRKQILGETPFAKCITQTVKFVEKELCENSDLIITCSDEDKKQFEELYNIDSHNIEVFPNGVDTNDIRPVDENTKKVIKEKLKIGQEKIAIFIGSEYQPNIDAGKYIIDKLTEECPDICFLIIGGVGEKLDSHDKKNVRIVGKVSEEDKKMLYGAADIAINPMSGGSGTNIKMFDYFAAGLPTISTSIGARGIENNDSFVITELSNFHKDINKIFLDRNFYKKLSNNGRLLVERYYDWNKISHRLENRLCDLYYNQSPYFSVIVPTYREEHIYKLLEKLNRQTFRDFEVIIVDSGTERSDVLYNINGTKLKYIFRSDVGAVKARNIGINCARGKIIAFTDDDCLPDRDWLENAKNHFEHSSIIGLEGRIYTDDSKINNPKYRTVTNVGFEGIGFMTANLFIRHDIIKKIGGFDECFDKPHFREDTDIAWRAQEYGHIQYATDICVFHPPHLRDVKGESKSDRDRFFIKDALLFAKHPEKYIKLIKAEGHYKNKNFWKFFLEGCKLTNGRIPIELMLKDSEINKNVPDELRRN